MKIFLIFLVLFILTMGLIIGMDYLQGFSWSEILTNIQISRTELTGEDYVLIFFFTVPFAVAKIILKILKKQKKVRNQQQNEGQNTAK